MPETLGKRAIRVEQIPLLRLHGGTEQIPSDPALVASLVPAPMPAVDLLQGSQIIPALHSEDDGIEIFHRRPSILAERLEYPGGNVSAPACIIPCPDPSRPCLVNRTARYLLPGRKVHRLGIGFLVIRVCCEIHFPNLFGYHCFHIRLGSSLGQHRIEDKILAVWLPGNADDIPRFHGMPEKSLG